MTMQPDASADIADLNAEAVLADLARCQSPFLIGVRHHSAAMAKVIPQLLDRAAPDIVLLELPPEFSEWLPWLAHPETKAPVALSGCDSDGGQLSFYPFADFSPELAAIRWAAQHDVPVEAFDLSVGERVLSRGERTVKPQGLLAALMERTESSDSGQLWERLVESPALGCDAESIRRSGLLFGWAMRWNDREPADYDLARESYMRSRIAAHRKKKMAAVIGAYHAAALLPVPLLWHELAATTPDEGEAAAVGSDHKGRRSGKKTETKNTESQFVTAMIPYSFQQLDERSGYPAGIRDPLWHQKILEAASLHECEEAVAQLIVSICRELRRAGHPMNAAEGMEVLRMSRDLARLRNLQAPGRPEVMESLQSCLTRGQLFGLGRAVADAMQVVLVGTCFGSVPESLPRCGLAPHIESILQQLRLPGPETFGQEKRLRLDPLRSALDRARVVVLEQMSVCQIPYAKRAEDGSVGDRESLTSVWDVQWQHATVAMIALAGTRGATLRQAAEGTLRSQGMEKPIEEWGEAQLLQLTFAAQCGLVEPVARGLEWLFGSFAITASLPQLMHAMNFVDRIRSGHIPGLPSPTDDFLPTFCQPFTVSSDLDGTTLLQAAIARVGGLAGSDDETDVAALLDLVLWFQQQEEGDNEYKPDAQASASNTEQFDPDAQALELRSVGIAAPKGRHYDSPGQATNGSAALGCGRYEIEALKGRPHDEADMRVAPSGLGDSKNAPTQGVALGWHNAAPLGLGRQRAQLHNAQASASSTQDTGSRGSAVDPSSGTERTRLRVGLVSSAVAIEAGRLLYHLRDFAQSGSPLMQGAALGCRLLTNDLPEADFVTQTGSWLDSAVDENLRRDLTRRLRGVLILVSPRLHSDPGCLNGMEDRIDRFTDTGFFERLPALRGGFDVISPATRKMLLRQIQHRLPHSPGSTRPSSIDPMIQKMMFEADQAARAAVIELMPDLPWMDELSVVGWPGLERLRETPGLPSQSPDSFENSPAPATPLDSALAERGVNDGGPALEASFSHPTATRRTLVDDPSRQLNLLDRWRLILGVRDESMCPAARRAARALDELYGQGSGEGSRGGLGGGSGAGDEAPWPNTRVWADELGDLFGDRVREEVLGTAVEKGRVGALAVIDEEAVRPSVELLQTVLSMKGSLPEGQTEKLRRIARRITDELAKELATRMAPALMGLTTPRPTRRPNRRLDLRRTVMSNLKTAKVDDEGITRLVPEQFFFRTPARRTMDWHLIFVVDVSGSMEPSVIYSALTAAIFSALPAISVTFLAFSTEVIDFTNHVEDPLAMLMEVQVGGGTFIWKGLSAARERLKVPARTIVLLVTDFEEGGSVSSLLGEVQALVDSGAKTLGLAALSDDGKPRYQTGIAAQVVSCGMPVAALSPLELARWVGEQIR